MFGEADQSKDDEYFGARIAAVGRFQFGLAHEIASKTSLKENVTSLWCYYYNGLLELISEKMLHQSMKRITQRVRKEKFAQVVAVA